jgi:hypothetical protein
MQQQRPAQTGAALRHAQFRLDSDAVSLVATTLALFRLQSLYTRFWIRLQQDRNVAVYIANLKRAGRAPMKGDEIPGRAVKRHKTAPAKRGR